MRLFEKILTAGLALVCVLNFLPPAWQPDWLNFTLVNMLALALVVHLAIEHSRWQMGPIYFLALFALLVMVGRQTNPGPWYSAGAGAIGLGLLALFSVLPVLLPVPNTPQPSGPYSVGTVTFDWTDPARPEIYSSVPGARRRIMVQAWYPAEPRGVLGDPAETRGAPSNSAETRGTPGDSGNSGGALRNPARGKAAGQPLPYLDHPERTLKAWARLPAFAFRHILLGSTHSYANAPLARSPQALPVLLFSHGWIGYRSQNNFQVEELASRGYVVFSADHTYGASATTFSDGSVVYLKPEALPAKVSDEEYDRAARRLGQSWVGDLRFVLDQAQRIQSGEIEAPFNGRLDLERVGVLGHSTGGGAAVEACWLDERFKAGLAMDAWLIPYDRQVPQQGLRQPFLFMQSENWDDPLAQDAGVSPRNPPLAAALFEHMRGWAYRLTIAGAKHPDFSELPLLTPLLTLTGLHGRIDPRVQMKIVDDYTLAFFDCFLRSEPAPLLDAAAPPFPQVMCDRQPAREN